MSWKLALVDFLPPPPQGFISSFNNWTNRFERKEILFWWFHRFVSFFFFFPAILMNRYDQLVARRRINVRKGNSCSCVKNSDCTCTDKSDTRFKPAQVKDYHVARLEEKKPTSNKIPEEPKVWPTIWPGVMTISWHNVMTIVCSVLTILLLFLLLLGNPEINLGTFLFFFSRNED